MPQTSRVSGVATKIGIESGGFYGEPFRYVQYHDTKVVRWNESKIILNAGGWQTVTTKLRMNQTSNQYGLGYQVYSKDGEWFVRYGGTVYPFDGSLEIGRVQNEIH